MMDTDAKLINLYDISGSLRVGDTITFEGAPYYPWYLKLWYHLRYMRHNNPMYKKPELRQFVVTWGEDSGQLEP